MRWRALVDPQPISFKYRYGKKNGADGDAPQTCHNEDSYMLQNQTHGEADCLTV